MSQFAAAGGQKFAAIAESGAGDKELVAAVTGRKIRVLSLTLYANTAAEVRFESGAGGTALTGVFKLPANEMLRYDFSEAGHFETAAGQDLSLELGNTSPDVAGSFVYQEVN